MNFGFEDRVFSGTTVRYELRGESQWIEVFAPTLRGEPFEKNSDGTRILGKYVFSGEPKFGPALLYRWKLSPEQALAANSPAEYAWSFGVEVLGIESEITRGHLEGYSKERDGWRGWAAEQFTHVDESRVVTERELKLIDRIFEFRDSHWDASRAETWLGGRIIVETLEGLEELVLFAAKMQGVPIEEVAAAMYLRALGVGRPVARLEIEDTHIIRPAAHTPPVFRFAPSRGA